MKKIIKQTTLSLKEIKKNKEKLLQIRKNLMEDVDFLEEDNLKKTSKDGSGDLSSYSIHMADMADDYDKTLNLNLVSNESNIIQDINDALEKIEKKVYGLCEKCGKKLVLND